jgi:NB-ARC domain
MDLEFLEGIANKYALSPEQTDAFLLRFDPNWRRESDAKLSGKLNIGESAFKKRLTVVYQKLTPLCKDLESLKRGKVEILRAALQRQWEQQRFEPATSRLKTSKPFPKLKLPDNFVNRPEAMNAIKAKLLREDDRTLVVSAIAGLGGIGKSVLASALILDKEVREWFVDGILWVPLGQHPDLQLRLGDCIRELDKSRDTFSANTLEQAAQYLDRLLMERKMLLVLDDVWNAAHADWFRVSQGNCRILVTTREAQLEGTDYYNLDLMTGDEAIELVRQKLGQQWKPEQEADVRAFANVLGHLPLALDLATIQVRDGLSWQELRLEFEAERRAVALGSGRRSALKLLDSSEAWERLDEDEQRKYSLQACFNLSLKRLNQKQFECFVWLGILPEDVSLDARVAAVLWNLELVDAQKVLIDLRNRSLLTTGIETSEKKPSYRIHDLIHDLARNSIERLPTNKPDRLGGFGLNLPTAHAQFLERYRSRTQDLRWDKLPNDGYIYRHLTWHMMKANWLDEIHSLLSMSDDRGRNAWFETCDRIGQPAIFVGDIARAWELAESMFDNNPEVSVKLQIHYALITSTLKSLTKQIPPNWIKLLVEHKYWTFEKAWSHTLEIKNKTQQAYTILALCSFIPINLVPDVLSLISSIPDDNKLQCLVFEELSKYVELDDLCRLNKSQNKQVIALTISVEKITKMLLEASRKEKEDNDDNVELLLEIVSDISKDNLELFLELCYELDPGTQVELLCELSGKFTHLKSQALGIFSSMSIEDASYDSAICSVVTIEHSFADRAALYILDTVDFSEISIFLPKIVAHVSDSCLDEFLSFVIFSTPDPYYQAEILGIMAPFLNNEMLIIALGIAAEIGLDEFRFSALDDMAPHVKSEQIQESFDLISSLQTDFERIWSLIRLGTLNDEIWTIVIQELKDGLKMNQFQWILIYRNLIYFLPKEIFYEIDLEVFTGTDRDEVTNIILKIDMLSRGMFKISEIVADILIVSDDDEFEALILLVLLASSLDKESFLAFASLFSEDRDDDSQDFFTLALTARVKIMTEWESLLLEISRKIDVFKINNYIPKRWKNLRDMVVDISNLVESGDTDMASFLTYTDNFLSHVPEVCPDASGLPHFVRDRLFYSLLEVETARSPYCNVIRDALILCVLDCKSEKSSVDRVLFHVVDLTLEALIGSLETISPVEANAITDKDENIWAGKELKIFKTIEDYTKFKLLLRDISQKGRREFIPFLPIVLNLLEENNRKCFSSIVADSIVKNCKQWQ